MEYNAFASLAHFRILLLPVGSISRETFDQWAAEIRTLEKLRLSDIPPGTKDEKGKHTLLSLHTPPAELSSLQLVSCPAPSPRAIYIYTFPPTHHLHRTTACHSSDHLISRWGSSALQPVHKQTPSPP